MYDNQIEIKERRKGLVAKGLIFLSFMLISLFVAFFPILFDSKNANVFYAIGGSMFLIFLLLYLFQIIKACKPNNAIVLTSNGFIDLLNVGPSVKIEWTNVSSVKILGKGDTPFLGIVLENSDIIISKMSKSKADIMRENIEEGLPAILIAQTEVRTPTKELRDLFVRFVRESRALENEVPQKTKVNPFSSEDVLRAFGKLPAKEADEITQEDTKEIDEEKSNHAHSGDDFYNILKEKTVEVPETQNEETEISEPTANDNSNEPNVCSSINDQATDESETLDEDVPQEIAELLSKAKSSKISEIGKILIDNDIPFSVARPEQTETKETPSENVAENNITVSESENTQTENTGIQSCNNDQMNDNIGSIAESAEPDTTRPSFVFPAEFYKQDDVEETQSVFENDLGSMLAMAFNDIQTDISVASKDKEVLDEPKTLESIDYYPELVFINDSDFEDDDDYKANNSLIQDNTENYNGGFITNIDDD